MKKIGHLIFLALFMALQPLCQADSVPATPPDTQSSATHPAATPQTTEPTTALATETKQPQTNEEIRQWYNDVVGKIPSLNEKWSSEQVSAEERAKRAHEIRHHARLEARTMMQNKQEVADLQARDQEK
ncbi:hypothetical protein THII_0502 [Thioploca ingrica]|uniref:Secreted protein n=1 Tax=Thioploca ingrica TaxID=40754 RepID=A0A090ADE4_9GAMM|nr:hypothetical protein THII_0502 [Thioploca ingrica]